MSCVDSKAGRPKYFSYRTANLHRSITFTYDGLRRRAQKTINSVLTQVQCDAATGRGGGSTAVYLRTLGIDEALVRTDPTDTGHYVGDALRSTVALSNPTGGVATTYTCEPFGRADATGTPSPNAFRDTGREDGSSGVCYARARPDDLICPVWSPSERRFALANE